MKVGNRVRIRKSVLNAMIGKTGVVKKMGLGKSEQIVEVELDLGKGKWTSFKPNLEVINFTQEE